MQYLASDQFDAQKDLRRELLCRPRRLMAGQVQRGTGRISDRPDPGASGVFVSDQLKTTTDRPLLPQRDRDYPMLTSFIPADAKVLEVGPGHAPFHRADYIVDFVAVDVRPAGFTSAIWRTEKLPFEDKSFDFVVCKTRWEDMYDPFPLCAGDVTGGQGRVISKRRPRSPKLCRGVDGITRRNIAGITITGFWCGRPTTSFRFVSKYPIIEHMDFSDDELAERLHAPKYWNTHHLWCNA